MSWWQTNRRIDKVNEIQRVDQIIACKQMKQQALQKMEYSVPNLQTNADHTNQAYVTFWLFQKMQEALWAFTLC